MQTTSQARATPEHQQVRRHALWWTIATLALAGLVVGLIGMSVAQKKTPHPRALHIRFDPTLAHACAASPSRVKEGVRDVTVESVSGVVQITIEDGSGGLVYKRTTSPVTDDFGPVTRGAQDEQESARFTVGGYQVTCYRGEGSPYATHVTVTSE